MFRILFIGLCLFGLFSCEVKNNRSFSNFNMESNDMSIVNDSLLVKNWNYEYGDIRRYGFDNKYLNNSQIDSIVNIASKGIRISFPEDIFITNLEIVNQSNLNLNFNSSVITGKFTLQDVSNINIEGNITILDILFLKKARDVFFDEVTLTTDIALNINKMANRGVNIYSGSKNVYIDDLRILNSGGTGDFFKYSQCSLMIHGFNNTPENIAIRKLLIKNSSRTGAYISGENHLFQKISIINYGLSTDSLNIKPIEKASKGEEKYFSGIWMNYSQNNSIDTLIIKNPAGKGDYSIVFDESVGTVPNTIKNISINDINDNKVNMSSNIIVLNEL